MANPHDHPTALKDLQDSIYREKVLRARRMTNEARWALGVELTNSVSERMLAGAMASWAPRIGLLAGLKFVGEWPGFARRGTMDSM